MVVLSTSWICDSIFIIIFSLFIIIYFYFTRNFKYWKKRGVKEIDPVPFFGNIAPFLLERKSFVELCEDYYKAGENEPFIGFYVFDRPHLLIRDPELLQNILIKDFNCFSNRAAKSNKNDSIGNMNLFCVNNPDWKYVKQKLTPLFTASKLKKMFEMMLEIDLNLMEYMKSLKLEGAGHPVDVKDIFTRFTMDVFGLIAYGLNFNTLKNESNPILKTGQSVFSNKYIRALEFSSTIFLTSLVDLFGFMFFGKDTTYFLKNMIQQTIDTRIKSKNNKRNDMIDFLIQIKKHENENSTSVTNKFNDEFLVAQGVIFFAAAFESTSTTLTFALFEIARHPEIQERLRLEIYNELLKNDGKITYEMVTFSLPYLNMVISETLRMYPILHYLDRMTETDYEIPNKNLIIEKGIQLLIPMHAIQMDKNYFPKPHVFDPERFSEENKKLIQSNTYLPFGNGPRMCIGKSLGLIESKLCLIRLISEYEFSPCKDTPIPMEYLKSGTILAPLKTIVLHVKKRTNVK